MCKYIYIYIYRERERERELEKLQGEESTHIRDIVTREKDEGERNSMRQILRPKESLRENPFFLNQEKFL